MKFNKYLPVVVAPTATLGMSSSIVTTDVAVVGVGSA